MKTDYRLFAWDFSYFSAKARAYFRFKEFHGHFTFEEVLATQDIIQGYIIPGPTLSRRCSLLTGAGCRTPARSSMCSRLDIQARLSFQAGRANDWPRT